MCSSLSICVTPQLSLKIIKKRDCINVSGELVSVTLICNQLIWNVAIHLISSSLSSKYYSIHFSYSIRKKEVFLVIFINFLI